MLKFAKILAGIAVVSGASDANGSLVDQLDRGHRLLLQYGYQLHAAPSPRYAYRNPNGTDSTNLTVLRNANFNGLNFESENWDQQMWTHPIGNYNWSRWDVTSTNPANPRQAGMMMASVWDEQWLGDPAIVNTMASRLASIRATTPNIISYVNDAGVTNTLAEIKNYMAVAQPDILSFDHYVFAYGDPWPGGSPTPLYDSMGKYRTAALAGNNGDSTKPIPYAMWFQTFKVLGGATLSESEMSLQYGAAWAYGYKALSAFRYSNEAANDPLQSVLFNGPNDSNPTPLYYTVARLNKQTQNLSSALLRLKSVNLQFVRGQHKQGIFNVNNALPAYASQWSAATSGDPYMTSISVTNAGNPNGAPKKNAGLRGDVIVGYFKLLHEDFDGPDFANQLYFMITNALTDSIGDKADTRQLIRLNFNFGTSGINSLQRLDRDTGTVVAVPLVSGGGTNYYLDWYLYGGEGDLFKYNTGARFVDDVHAAWARNASGDWNADVNWIGGIAPNGVGDEATLGGVITAARTVYADTAITLGTLTFNSASTYNLTGAASLTIETVAGSGYIGAVAGNHKINLPVTFADNTNIAVAAGATLTLADPVVIKAGKTVTRTGAGALAIQAPLSIEAGGTLALGAGAMTVSGVPSLASEARIDVAGETLLVDYHGQQSPAAAIASQLSSGYSQGEWNGEGIMTSAGTYAMGLGWIDDSSEQTVRIQFTYNGDADLSGTVDSTDFNALLAGYGQTLGAVWANGDFNYDNKVDTRDFNALAGNFGAVVSIASLGAAVPEPASGASLLLCALAGIRPRRVRVV